MKFRTETELKDAAFAKGATATIEGRPFNTEQRTAIRRAPRIEPELAAAPKPEAAPAPGIDQSGIEKALASRDRQFIAELRNAFAEIAPTQWRFKVVRDKDRLIDEIIATPKKG